MNADAATWTLRTERLLIRYALPVEEDIELLCRLWANGEVMKFVGFPSGFKTDHERIKRQLEAYSGDEFGRVLLACLPDGTIIGECKLGKPDENGVRNTDIKLLPEFWGNAYGREIKRALVGYLFANTDCVGVLGTPHRDNVASIKMQESVGARRVGEETHRFPEEMRHFTCDVPHFKYIVYREDWDAGA